MTATDDLGFAQVDLDRARRRGYPESIYCPGKTVEEVLAIAGSLTAGGTANVLATRVPDEALGALQEAFPGARVFRRSRIVVLNPTPAGHGVGHVAVVCRRPEDLAVAEEAYVVADAMGSYVSLHPDIPLDVPSALPAWVDGLGRPKVYVVVEGTGSAASSILAGLVGELVVAVPTSTHDGMSGAPALLSALCSCVPGVVTVNVDNGFGAAYAAHVINTTSAGRGRTP